MATSSSLKTPQPPANLLAQLAKVDTSQSLKDVGPLGEGIWIGILGPKRSGKGLMTVSLALQAAMRGVEIYHFGNLNFGTQIDDALTLLEQNPNAFRNALIVFDEAKAHAMSSRQAATVMLLFENIMTQSGHFNVSVLWTTTSQSGLHRVFIEQTHMVYWIDQFGVTKEELFDRRPEGMPLREGWARGLTNKCEGWADPAIDGERWSRANYVSEHQGPPGLIDCREALIALRGQMVPGKHKIAYLLTSQAGSRWGRAGYQETGAMRCAHRFYKLNQTDAYISAMSMATTTAEDVRAAKSVNHVELVVQAVRDLVQDGRDAAFPYDISSWCRKVYDQEISEARVGSILASSLGVETVKKSARGRPNRRSGYAIAAWVEAHPDVDVAELEEQAG